MEPVQTPRVFSNRYELTHLIARGGMAQVYRARDRLLDRPVALKVLFPELSVDRAFVERFRREAQAAANLSQPNIVPVFDWGEDNGTYFIVMEFVDGRPLSALLRASGTLTPERTADIGAHVASALAYAHRHGVVHRDVKPGNVLITDDGQVKVTDFGIARAVNTEESLTQTGAVMGTAAYFSPEQAEGIGVDSRSDIYSLGVVLFEMLTGRTPFLGDTPVAVASKHVRDQPPLPREINPTVPPQLEAVVMKAMAKSPDRRYATAEELRADLLRFSEGLPVQAGEVAATSVQSAVGATVAVGAVAAAATSAQPRIRPLASDVTPEEEEDEEARRRTKRLWTILIVLLVALVVVAFLLVRTLGHGNTFAMPNVVGQSVSSATATLDDKGLTVGATDRSHSSQPVGTVTSTNPAQGTQVKKGQSVTLIVSSGPSAAQVLVPNVVGQQLTDAATILNGVNLGYSVKSEESSKPSGEVLSQTPGAGSTAPTGTDIVLTVSTQTTTTVPNVVGQNQTTAGSILAQNSLTVGNVTQQCSSSNVATGLVISSNPAAGTSLPPQSPVALVVSTGACQVTLLNVVGLTQAQATSNLQGQNPQITVVPSTTSNCTSGQNGTVVTQNPTGGTQVNVPSSVAIIVCNSSSSSSTTTTTSGSGTSSTTTTSGPGTSSTTTSSTP